MINNNMFCRIGALTSKNYTFNIKPYEQNINNVFYFFDYFDFFNNFVKIELNINRILRILPINRQYYISDYSRFFFDCVNYNRFDKHYYNNNIVNFAWLSNFIANKLVQNSRKVLFVNSDLHLNTWDVYNFRKINKLFDYVFYFFKKSNFFFNYDYYIINSLNIYEFIDLFNIDAKIGKNTEVIFFYCNLRYENPRLNVIINNFKRRNNFINVNFVGFFPINVTYNYKFFGSKFTKLFNFFNGRMKIFNNFKDKRFIFVFGNSYNSVYFNYKNFTKNKFFNFVIFIKKYFVNIFSVFVLPCDAFESNNYNFIACFDKKYLTKNFKIFSKIFFNYFVINVNNYNTVISNFNISSKERLNDFFNNIFANFICYNSYHYYNKTILDGAVNNVIFPTSLQFERNVFFEKYYSIKQKNNFFTTNNSSLLGFGSNLGFVFCFKYFMNCRYSMSVQSSFYNNIISYFNYKIVNFEHFSSFYWFFYKNFVNYKFVLHFQTFFVESNYFHRTHPVKVIININNYKHIPNFVFNNSANLQILEKRFRSILFKFFRIVLRKFNLY